MVIQVSNGLSAQQTLYAVCKHEFDCQLGVLSPKSGDDGRQYFHTDYITGGHANGTAHSRTLAGRGALEGSGCALHRFGVAP
jgi:hypothetical protein